MRAGPEVSFRGGPAWLIGRLHASFSTFLPSPLPRYHPHPYHTSWFWKCHCTHPFEGGSAPLKLMVGQLGSPERQAGPWPLWGLEGRGLPPASSAKNSQEIKAKVGRF